MEEFAAGIKEGRKSLFFTSHLSRDSILETLIWVYVQQVSKVVVELQSWLMCTSGRRIAVLAARVGSMG